MEALFAIFWGALVLITTSQLLWALPFYEMDDNSAHGVRCSGDDQFTVLAANIFKSLIISFHSEGLTEQAEIRYEEKSFYVYSLAVISNNNNTFFPRSYRLVQVGEDMETQNVLLIYSIVSQAPTGGWQIHNTIQTIAYGVHQEYMFLKIHPSQSYAYLFTDSFILTFNTSDFKSVNYTNMSSIISDGVFQIHAVDITENYGILIGVYTTRDMINLSQYFLFSISLAELKLITGIVLDERFYAVTQSFSYSRANDMSVAVNARRHLAIIGLPSANKVVLVRTNAANSLSEKDMLNITRIEVAQRDFIGFGRSVAWLDDTKVAIAILKVPHRLWSQSEVWIFDVDKSLQIPQFTFPNNQQKILMSSPPVFLQILILSGSLCIVTDQHQLMLVPMQSAGLVSVFSPNPGDIFLKFKPAMCMAGTYKNTSSFGPCTVCPPQTKNTGNQPCSTCEPCASTSFCPLGSVNDLSIAVYPSYKQTFSYPDTPDMNNYDDLLVQNIFTIPHSASCILISPLFWTIIAIALCSSVWLLMTVVKVCNCPNAHFRRNRAKKFFKKTDIVNEGEHWIGGLFSFAVVLVFGFTLWFSSEYLKLYPIEVAGSSSISCDDSVRNAVFDSALQLPLYNPDGSRWPIFDLLDTQSFTVTVDLLNTAADCPSISAQQNRPGINYLVLPFISCVLQPDNSTRSLSFLLPAHRTSVQLNITGPYFVGGMRLCLYGAARVDNVHSLQAFDVCQLFTTVNETLSRLVMVDLVMIKVINMTKPLEAGGDTHYSGRWAPTVVESSHTDELTYKQDGEYLRYVSERTTLTITLSEQPFYLLNTQQPIVRKAELAFHTLLFCTLIIELFGMSFLICRLALMPLIRAVLRCCQGKRKNRNATEAPSRELESVSSVNDTVF